MELSPIFKYFKFQQPRKVLNQRNELFMIDPSQYFIFFQRTKNMLFIDTHATGKQYDFCLINQEYLFQLYQFFKKMNILQQEKGPRPISGNESAKAIPRPKKEGFDIGQVHQLTMIIIWIGLANVGLFTMLFKHRKWALYLHIFCMSGVNIITWMSGFLALANYGLNHRIGQFHTYLGLSIMILVAIQTIMGFLTWTLQKSYNIKPSTVYLINWIHRILGLILLVLPPIEICYVTFEKKLKIFIPAAAISFITLLVYLFVFTFQRKFSVLHIESLQDCSNNINVSKLEKYQQIQTKFEDYFIFADRIFNIHNILTNHPGGYEVIRSIRGKQVDRYIYGSQSIEAQAGSSFFHTHSMDSIKLLGVPMGVIYSNPPYKNLEEVNNSQLTKKFILKGCEYLHILYLKSTNQNEFEYEGYSDFSQLGKYFAITIQQNITRLYTSVNFLQPLNIQLIKSQIRDVKIKNQFKSLTEDQENIKFEEGVIPLLIKKYENSKLTSKLLKSEGYKGKIRISKAYGRGLSLHQMPPGKIIIIAGGTGINPFLDLFDLAYKEKTFPDQSYNIDRICQKMYITKNLSFQVLITVNSTTEINRISLYQLNQLSKSEQFMKVYIKSKQRDEYYGLLTHLVSRNGQEQFWSMVPMIITQSNIESISQIYVCGPSKMQQYVQKVLLQNSVPKNKYRLL